MIQKRKHLSMVSCGYPYFVGGVFDDPNMLISTPTGVQRDPCFFSNIKNSKAIVPNLPGKDLEGVTTLQNMEDAVYLKERVKKGEPKKAVIVGGGLIGIETCEALQLGGAEITVVEMQDQVLSFLDWEMAKLVENHIKSKGSNVITGMGVTEFLGGGGKARGVKLSDGRTLECDLVVVAIAVRPNSAPALYGKMHVADLVNLDLPYAPRSPRPSIILLPPPMCSRTSAWEGWMGFHRWRSRKRLMPEKKSSCWMSGDRMNTKKCIWALES